MEIEETPAVDAQSKSQSWWGFAGIFALLLCCPLTLGAIAGIYLLRPQPTPDPHSLLPASPTPSSTSSATPSVNVTPRPQPPITNNRIAYIDPDGALRTISPDGAEERLIDDERAYQFPVWSPDGGQIAVIGAENRQSGVYIFADQQRGSSSASFTAYERQGQPPIYLYWSPDSAYLSFIANHPEGIGLFLSGLLGANDARLLATGQPFYWDWLPDSEGFLLHSDAGNDDERLRFYSLADGEEPNNLAQPGAFQSPGISFNGDYWAFSTESETGSRWLTAQNNLGLPAAQARHRGVIAFNWNPVAHQIAYISPNEELTLPYGALRLFDVATGENILLSRNRIFAFFWSPDGRKISYIAQAGANQHVAAVAGKDRRYLPIRQPDVSFELELWVVDVATQKETLLTTFIPSRQFLFQFIPFFDQYGLSHRLWSPASDALTLPMIIDNEEMVVVAPASGGDLIPLAPGQMPVWSQQ